LLFFFRNAITATDVSAFSFKQKYSTERAIGPMATLLVAERLSIIRAISVFDNGLRINYLAFQSGCSVLSKHWFGNIFDYLIALR
jgi:hypothetical protein